MMVYHGTKVKNDLKHMQAVTTFDKYFALIHFA